MSGRANAAILFEPSAFDADRKKVMGRNVAGASFLEGFVRHAEVDRYVGIGYRESYAPEFRRQIGAIAAGRPELAARPVEVFTPRDVRQMAAVGTLFIPDPQLTSFATSRRQLDQRGYSLCGVTHTISSLKVMEVLCELLTGPVQSWDALICTSRSVRDAVLRQQEHYADYLSQRLGVRPTSPVQMPVIPLGVDTDRFARLGGDAEARASLRRRIGAEDGDTVVLFFGRLAFHAKAHPVPMYLGAQRAARRLGPGHGRIHLVQTGQFPNQVAEDGYRGGAQRYCPDVAVHFLDGSDRALSDASWAAADVFVTLSDNIQESFGITPVEAMAAGLPCLVSDWDGYRDTVVDGETGIRVPTWLPVPGCGAALADAYAADKPELRSLHRLRQSDDGGRRAGDSRRPGDAGPRSRPAAADGRGRSAPRASPVRLVDDRARLPGSLGRTRRPSPFGAGVGAAVLAGSESATDRSVRRVRRARRRRARGRCGGPARSGGA